jgi:arylsulfatase A-like enzyme
VFCVLARSVFMSLSVAGPRTIVVSASGNDNDNGSFAVIQHSVDSVSSVERGKFAGSSVIAVLFAAILLPCSAFADSGSRPNVLFIAIDDMNDWTGFLGGHDQAKTPNMDRLARNGVNFRNAHCPAPACSPCRNALLFGVEPFHSGLYPFYDLHKMDVDVLEPYTSLPQFFMDRGYQTFGAGKIHHGAGWSYEKGGAGQWTENNYAKRKSLPKLVYDPEGGYVIGKSRKMAFCPTKSPLEHHPDYCTASFGVDVLERQHDSPFFLAVGFIKPHLAFVCPQKYFDLYPEPISPPAIRADDLVDVPWPGRGNAKIKDDLKYRSDDAWQKVHRSYLACISWTDSNVGRVLDALEASPYAKNTIVVLWSDHGYHQGEKRSFRKFSLWEEATRVPFIIWDTRGQQGNGQSCDEAVSLVDIYKTLTDLAGLERPEYVDGVSLAPWLKEPSKARTEPAYITWGRGNYAVRTCEWRYIRYFDGSEELYHNAQDPQEWVNLASDPDFAQKKVELANKLPKQEAPLVLSGKALHNVVDADQPKLDSIKRSWKSVNDQIEPPLE